MNIKQIFDNLDSNARIEARLQYCLGLMRGSDSQRGQVIEYIVLTDLDGPMAVWNGFDGNGFTGKCPKDHINKDAQHLAEMLECYVQLHSVEGCEAHGGDPYDYAENEAGLPVT